MTSTIERGQIEHLTRQQSTLIRAHAEQKRTIPGSKPPSITPKRHRTATKLPKPRTNPRHMVMIPHRAVINGSQIFGDAFLIIRLLGSSLSLV